MSDTIDLAVLAESFSEYLGETWPREKAVAYARTGDAFAADLWSGMAELGWTALTVPEAHGGLGLGLDAAATLHAALGAAVAPVPMLGTTLAVELLIHAGSDAQQAQYLPGLADGSARYAFAPASDAAIKADGSAVSGTFPDLVDAGSATMLCLRAERGGKAGWLIIATDAAGVAIAHHPLADTTRTLGTVTLTDVAVSDDRFIASSPAIDDAILRTACVIVAADAIGGGKAVLAATIEYMKGREQFGVVIASFQALKHRVADHQANLVAGEGLLTNAASLAADDGKALLMALSAKQHITRTVAEIARDCVQLHGGVGFTAEYVPHLYLKRGKVNEVLFGTRIALLDRIADILEAA